MFCLYIRAPTGPCLVAQKLRIECSVSMEYSWLLLSAAEVEITTEMSQRET